MPLFTRARRRWIAASAVALVAFAHAAIAVAGCLTNVMPVSESGCDEHQQASPEKLTCRTHLQAENQTLDLAKLPQVLHFNAPVLMLSPTQAFVLEFGFAVPARTPVAGAPPPPLNVLYSRSLT